jgi:pimeloyl-ACP methyl ester carboxylesterase
LIVEEHFFDLDGTKAHCVTAGEGKPIVLLHGWGASWHVWQWTIPLLVEANFRVYAPDLIGHGDSAKPPLAYVAEDYDVYLEALLAHLGIPSAILVGHSLGGHIALRYAVTHPSQVDRLVLLDPIYTKGQLAIPWITKLDSLRLGESLYRVFPYRLLRFSTEWPIYGLRHLPPSFKDKMARDYKVAHPRIVNSVRNLEDLRPHLRQVSAPTLIVWGDRDLLLKPWSFPPLVEKIPRAHGYEVKRAGHIPQVEAIEEFNAVLLDFLNGSWQRGLAAEDREQADG